MPEAPAPLARGAGRANSFDWESDAREAKPAMQSGFNTNIRHRGVLFHVQTEDSGKANPHVITHLFHGGNIMSSEKVDYREQLEREDLIEAVRELMESQHKKMLRALKNGECDVAIGERLGDGIFGDSTDSEEVQAAPLPRPEPATETIQVVPEAAPPPQPARTPAPPAAPRFFGERASTKPLDEMVLDYLVENARKRKRSAS